MARETSPGGNHAIAFDLGILGQEKTSLWTGQTVWPRPETPRKPLDDLLAGHGADTYRSFCLLDNWYSGRDGELRPVLRWPILRWEVTRGKHGYVTSCVIAVRFPSASTVAVILALESWTAFR